MTTTIQPRVYELVLTCGHKQLATHALPVGRGYPCWTACNAAHPVRRAVAEVNIYKPRDGDSFIVASGVNNDDMLELQKTVDLANRSLD